MRSGRPVLANLYAIVLLIALNIFCFFRSVNGFFLADDFSHIDYLHTVFAGHPELLLQNFYSNWLQAQGTKFFRPFISITMAWDYLIWKNNPLGFHLTNLSFQIASTVLLFFIVKRLFPISRRRSFWLALASASLFAVNPLHPEVVSWIIARVDSVAAAFLLAAFYLHQRGLGGSRNNVFRLASIASFLMALMSKETAITLPPVLFLWHFIFPERKTSAASPGDALADAEESSHTEVDAPKATKFDWVNRGKNALACTWQYWLLLVIFLVYRSFALGTIIGGYGGSMGEGLTNSFWKRWLDPQSIQKVFFPFNDEVFHNSSRMKRYLRWLYQAGAILFVANSFLAFKRGKLALYWRMIVFASGWFVIAMVPAYQVWNLSSTLQGSRFIYMGSLPLSLLFTLLVMPILQMRDKSVPAEKSSGGMFIAARALAGFSSVVLVGYILVSAWITQKNNSAWYHASQGVRSLYKAMRSELANVPPDKSIVLMNLPFRYQGAHMLYNGFTFGALLRPPFMKEDSSKRVQLFEPIEFGDSDLINLGRLRSLVQREQPLIYKWDVEDNKLLPVSLSWDADKVEIETHQLDVPAGETIYSPEVSFSSTAIDYLEVSMNIAQEIKPDTLKLSWSGPSLLFATNNSLWTKLERRGNILKARIYVSEHKKWLQAQNISKLAFTLYPAQTYKIENFKAGGGRMKELPTLTAGFITDTTGSGMVEDELGMAHPHKRIGDLSYDASHVPDADHVVFQISKPDSWFEQTKNSFRSNERDDSEVAVSHVFKALKGDKISFPSSELKVPGFYEIRVGAASKNNNILLSYSDPINFYLSEADVRASK